MIKFTDRELSILSLLSKGITTDIKISKELGTKEGTVGNQISAMITKAHVHNRTELVVKYILGKYDSM